MAHPKEKRQKLEETKEEHIIKQKCLRLLFALQLAKVIYTTEHTGMR